MAALLGLFWRLLREGRLKVARGRSWQPEIGMEHASRGRRSGNKGVGARWRGRFRIFSARHRSRTKVSHAENSGMTTVVFFFGDCSGVGGRFFHTLGSGQTRMPPQSDGTRGFWFCGGALLPFVLRACCGGMCWPVDRPATHAAAGFCGGALLPFVLRALLPFILRACCGSMCWPVDRPATHAAAGAAARGVFGFVGGVVAVYFEGLLREHVLAGGPASHACRRRSGSTRN